MHLMQKDTSQDDVSHATELKLICDLYHTVCFIFQIGLPWRIWFSVHQPLCIKQCCELSHVPAKHTKHGCKMGVQYATQHYKAIHHPEKASGMCGPHSMSTVHAALVSGNELDTLAALLMTTEKGILPCLSHHGHNTSQQQTGLTCLLSACEVAVRRSIHTQSHNSSRTSCWPHGGHSCGCR